MSGNKKTSRRVWEIDAWRGVVIICMAFFHLLYDLHFFYGYSCNPFELPLTPALIVSLGFFPLAGLSSGFSRNTVLNGLRCALFAILLSLITRMAMPQNYIRFGTLHLLSIAMLLTPIWKRLSNGALLVSAVSIALLGYLAARTSVANPWLFPFGLLCPDFTSLDYFPLLPYLAPYLLGIVLYRKVYALRGHASLLPEVPLTKPLQWLGRHSLPIYLLHQPLILALLTLLLGLPQLMPN